MGELQPPKSPKGGKYSSNSNFINIENLKNKSFYLNVFA